MRRLRVRAERESPAESGRRAPQMSGRAVHYSSPCRKGSVRKGWLSTPASCRFLAMPEMAAPGTSAKFTDGARHSGFGGQADALRFPSLPSRPGDFHPEPLTDPDLILSHHPARVTARRLPPSVECQVPPV